MWDGHNEIDGFNALVLGAGLTWRQATVLRAYAKYMRQGGTPFAQDYIEDALRNNVDITRLLVELFETRFDPARELPRRRRGGARRQGDELEGRLARALDDVVSLDQDRILRSYLTLIRATLRTNYFQSDADGRARSPTSRFKLDPSRDPRPARAAAEVRDLRLLAARRGRAPALRPGGARRPALVRPPRGLPHRGAGPGQGADGQEHGHRAGRREGRLLRQATCPGAADRDAWLAEGVACYKTFISGLLDITDNLVGGQMVPPRDVVRHDGDDPYLVVAADKGTATFSDIANGVAEDYGFWLGDAFASGGSVGYDHKAMGITARGAWESVKRHFREMGVDSQTEDFTCVGIGDMSGDVFGNGMLLSEHIRLVAAFDHRHIFLDPTRTRRVVRRARAAVRPAALLWEDYDTSLISEGGGVFPRSQVDPARAPQIAAAARHRRLDHRDDPGRADEGDPAGAGRPALERRHRHLRQGRGETHADVGDKANDAVRVNGEDLRCKVVGEGGNLGLTQRGRIEFAPAAAASTPTSSTTPPASTPPTTRSTSRSCWTGWSSTATSPASSATSCWRR